MEIHSFAKNIRISSQKVKGVADLVRGQTPSQAVTTLKFVSKKAAKPLSSTIASAIANAKHNFGIEKETLRFKKLEVLKGSAMKRHQFAAHGRVRPILKRLTHIRVVLEPAQEPKIKGEVAQEKTTEKPQVAKATMQTKEQNQKTLGKKTKGGKG